MPHPARRLSPVSAFLLGVLFMFGIHGGSAIASDTPENPCLAPSAPTDPLAEPQTQAPSAPAPVPPPLRLSEIFPDPAGKDTDGEFIEVENVSDEEVDAGGWRIADAKGKVFVIPATRVAAHGSHAFVYAETKISLVNVAAGYVLQSPEGMTADAVAYPAPVPEGKSYARFESGWRWTETPTQGATNVFSETVASSPEPTTPQPTDAAPPAAELVPMPATPDTPIAPPPQTITVSIDEVLPNPDGDDATEWVELRNDGDEPAPLAGWMIDDAEGGSAPYAFTTESAPAHGRLVVRRETSKIAFNNDADDVRLIAPDGNVRQSVRYEDAPSGKSFANDGTLWRWTTPTPGDANRFDHAAAEAPSVGATSEAVTADEEAVTETTIEDAAALDDDTLVSVSGTVTLPPGIVGKTIMAVRDADGTHGAFVRVRGKAAVAALRPGDAVALRGRVRRDGTALLSVNAKDVRKTGQSVRGAIANRDPASVTEDDAGLFVAVSGTVTAKGMGWVRIGAEGDGSEIRGLFSKGIGMGSVDVGDTATVTGVVRFRSGKPEIVIFEKGSFQAQKSATTDDRKATTAEKEPVPENRETLVLSAKNGLPMSRTWTLVAVVSLCCSVAGYALWKRRRFA